MSINAVRNHPTEYENNVKLDRRKKKKTNLKLQTTEDV